MLLRASRVAPAPRIAPFLRRGSGSAGLTTDGSEGSSSCARPHGVSWRRKAAACSDGGVGVSGSSHGSSASEAEQSILLGQASRYLRDLFLGSTEVRRRDDRATGGAGGPLSRFTLGASGSGSTSGEEGRLTWPYGAALPPKWSQRTGALTSSADDAADARAQSRVICTRLIQCIQNTATTLEEYEELRVLSEKSATWDVHARVLTNYAAACVAEATSRGRDTATVMPAVATVKLNTKAAALFGEAIALHVAMGSASAAVELRLHLAEVYSVLGRDLDAEKEYAAAISVMKMSARDQLPQMVPGNVATRPNSCSRVYAAYGTFLSRFTTRASEAVTQLMHALQHNRPTDVRERLDLLLSIARLQKREELYSESCDTYTRYLSELWEHNMRDTHYITFELARLLHYQLGNLKSAVTCYETACELALEEVQRAMDKYLESDSGSEEPSEGSPGGDDGGAGEASLPQPLVDAMYMQGVIMYNAAMCYTAAPEHGVSAALGVFEESIALLEQCGKTDELARVRVNFARGLCDVALIDQAISQYLSALRIVQSPLNGANPQIGEDDVKSVVHPAEVHGHLAHCLQYHVTDFKRAAKHYKMALAATGYPAEVTGFTAQTVRSAGGTHLSLDSLTAASLCEPGRVRADIVCWILESYSDCCMRLGDPQTAIRALLGRIKIGSLLGDHCATSYVRLANAFRDAGDMDGHGEVLHHLVLMPKDAMTTSKRYISSISYATYLETRGRLSEAAQWFLAAIQLTESHPGVLARCAAVLQRLPNSDPSVVSSLYMKAVTLLEVRESLRAIHPLEALPAEPPQHGSDALVAEEAREYDALETTLPNDGAEDVGAADAPGGAGDELADDGDPIALPAFVIFGMAAAFFHTVGSFDLAERMYQKAFSSVHDDTYIRADPSLSEHLCMMAANYAKLLYGHRKENALAQEYFAYAASVSPESFTLANQLAEFYLDTGNYSKGFQHVVAMINKMPGDAAGMTDVYHKLARLGEYSLNLADRESKETVLRYYILSLGISPSRVPAEAPPALAETSEDAREVEAPSEGETMLREPIPWEKLLLEGMTVCKDVEAANCCIAFVHHTLCNPALASKCYLLLIPRFRCNTTLLANYATLCCEVGAVAQARKLLARAYALDSNSAQLLEVYAGTIERFFPQHQTAAEALRRHYVKNHPQNANGHLSYANALAAASPACFTAAARHYRIALQLAPQNPALYAISASFVDHCVQCIPSLPRAVREEMVAGAEALMQIAMKLAPNDADKVLCAAIFYSHCGEERVPDAMMHFDKALQIDPHNFSTLTNFATFLHNRCTMFLHMALHPFGGGASGNTVPLGLAQAHRPKTHGTRQMPGSSAMSPEQAFTWMSGLAKGLYEKALRMQPLNEQTLTQLADFELEIMRDTRRSQELHEAINTVRDHKSKVVAVVQRDLVRGRAAVDPTSTEGNASSSGSGGGSRTGDQDGEPSA